MHLSPGNSFPGWWFWFCCIASSVNCYLCCQSFSHYWIPVLHSTANTKTYTYTIAMETKVNSARLNLRLLLLTKKLICFLFLPSSLAFSLYLWKSLCNWYRLIWKLFYLVMWISLSQAAALFINLSLGNPGTKCLTPQKCRHTMPNKSLRAIRKALKGKLKSLMLPPPSRLHWVPIAIYWKL